MNTAPTTTPVTVGGKKNNAQGYVLERIAAAAKKRFHKNAYSLLNETINPLWNIDERKAEMIYNWARSGNYAQVQYLYNDIENKDPTLGVCVTRRTSAVAELDWRVVRSDQRRNRDIDQKLVDEQIACVETAMAKIDNMPDALEHLALSAFRGFSAVAPVHSINGDIAHLDLIDGWNLCYDRAGQSWLFNPSATSFFLPTNYTMASNADWTAYHALDRIPKEAMCVVTRKREIDWPAMQIFLRCAVGERDWGRFLETYGLPPVIITMPEFTSKEDQEAYVKAAESVFEGRSGVVPYGSNISFASESRGTNPFTEFIEHQQKLIVMMATGGTLATLAESGSGTLAGDAQQDEWKRIIRADKRIISNAINKQICEPILRAAFKGQPILAEFQLDDTPKPTPKEMLELAGAAASAGFEMDAEELSHAIGYKLTKKVEGGGMGFEMPTTTDGGNGGESITIPDTDDKGDTDPNAGEVTEPVATNEVKPCEIDEESVERIMKASGFKSRAQVGRFGTQWVRGNEYGYDDDGNAIGKQAVVYDRNGYFDFAYGPADGYTKTSLRCRTADDIKRAISAYSSFTAKNAEVATNEDEGLEDDGCVEADNTTLFAQNTPQPRQDAVAGVKTDNVPQKEETPSTPVSAPITKEDKIANKALVEMAKAVQTDFKTVADRIAEILALPEAERAGAAVKLMQDLDRLVPDDGDIAEVIRGEMQKAFDGTIKQ